MDDSQTSGQAPETLDEQDLAESGNAAQKPIEPWERQHRETAPAWQAFKAYRDMGLERSLSKVGQQLGKSTPLMSRWSARWKWVRRCEAWDREQDRVETIQLNKERKAAAKRHAELFRAFLAATRKAIVQKFGDDLSKINAETFSVAELLKSLVDAAKAERLALGEPETIQRHEHTGAQTNDGERPIPITFTGQLDEALALLETARKRSVAQAAEKPDQS